MKKLFCNKLAVSLYSLFISANIIGATVVEAKGKAAKPENIYRGISDDLTPELAKPGKFKVGVQTLQLVNPMQFDVATATLKDRPITIELWYPAKKAKKRKAVYENVTRSHLPFSLRGQAYRKAKPIDTEKFPLVVISHGYTGYRTLMFYLGEHLASHGYVVAAIDHTDSTNAEIDIVNGAFNGFPSTLYNRSRDQQFVLEALNEHEMVKPLLQANSAGLIGYSMGGYGALNTIGACYQFSAGIIGRFLGISDEEKAQKYAEKFSSCAGDQYEDYTVDARWQAAMVLAPWGNQLQIFDPEAVRNITVPLLMVSGNLDDISPYAANQALFNLLEGHPAYFLTYLNARHNVAGHPAPSASRGTELDMGFHWEGSWNTEQINTINEHFALAMMDCYIKKRDEACEFLEIREKANQEVVNGELLPPWKGFPARFSTGMTWQKK